MRIFPLTGGNEPFVWIDLEVTHPNLCPDSDLPKIEILKEDSMGLNE